MQLWSSLRFWQPAQKPIQLYSIGNILYTVLSISGFVPNRLTPLRSIVMGSSVLFGLYWLPTLTAPAFGVSYFLVSTAFYLLFIGLVLPERGLRIHWIEREGEEQAFRQFEGVLAFLFFHNALSLSHLSQVTPNTISVASVPNSGFLVVVGLLIVGGTIIKIWSAVVVGIPIYFWKDMFLGRSIGPFVVQGPYRFLTNPMYGVGQLQVYGVALYYESLYGLIAALCNQLLVFGFYFWAEQPFIERTYLVGNERSTNTHQPLMDEIRTDGLAE